MYWWSRLRLTAKRRTTLSDVVPHQRQVNDILFGSLNLHDFQELGRILRNLGPSFEHGAHLMEFILKRILAPRTRAGSSPNPSA